MLHDAFYLQVQQHAKNVTVPGQNFLETRCVIQNVHLCLFSKRFTNSGKRFKSHLSNYNRCKFVYLRSRCSHSLWKRLALSTFVILRAKYKKSNLPPSYWEMITSYLSPNSFSFCLWSWLGYDREASKLEIGDASYSKASKSPSVSSKASDTNTTTSAAQGLTTQSLSAYHDYWTYRAYPCSRIPISSSILLMDIVKYVRLSCTQYDSQNSILNACHTHHSYQVSSICQMPRTNTDVHCRQKTLLNAVLWEHYGMEVEHLLKWSRLHHYVRQGIFLTCHQL